MYRILIANTVISAIAYATISIIGIFVVSWQVGAYGLAAYGVIALARLFLPTGLAVILDLGAPENASHLVATSRANGDWNSAGTAILSLVVIVCSVSILPCVALFFGASLLTGLFKLSAYDAALLAESLRYLALLIPFFLIGSIAEGSIRGFEKYGTVRGIEVMASLTYGVACYVFIREGLSYAEIIYLGIGVSIVRAVLSLVAAWRCFFGVPISFHQWRTQGMPIAIARTRVLAFNKVLGCIQVYLPTLVIGMLFGAIGAASYDILTRLPRFAKSVLGLLNSAIMPFTSRLEAEEKNISRISENGMLLVAVFTSGPLFAAATFSQPLLKLWIGESLADEWAWQSLSFSGPLFTVLLGFGFNTLFGRIHVNRAINAYIVIRILIQYGLAFALTGLLAERAFILAASLAVFATAYWEFRMIFREHGWDLVLARRLLSMAGIGLILLLLFLPTITYIHTLWQLALIGAIFCALYLALVWCFVLPDFLRQNLRKHLTQRTY